MFWQNQIAIFDLSDRCIYKTKTKNNNLGISTSQLKQDIILSVLKQPGILYS